MMSKKLTKRETEALSLKVAAISILQSQGKSEIYKNILLLTKCDIENLSLESTSEFLDVVNVAVTACRPIVYLQSQSEHPFWLDIWTPEKKVFSCRWGSSFLIVSFHRGSWEERIKRLADKLPREEINAEPEPLMLIKHRNTPFSG